MSFWKSPDLKNFPNHHLKDKSNSIILIYLESIWPGLSYKLVSNHSEEHSLKPFLEPLTKVKLKNLRLYIKYIKLYIFHMYQIHRRFKIIEFITWFIDFAFEKKVWLLNPYEYMIEFNINKYPTFTGKRKIKLGR